MRRLVFILPVLFSCETTIDPRLPDNGSGLVIYSFFRPGSELRIDAFNTIPIRETETMQRNKDLQISILENGHLVGSLTANAQGAYVSNIIPVGNSTYSFEATTGSKRCSATSFIPEVIQITNAEISETPEYVNTSEYGYPARITLADPKESENFYSLEVLVENCEVGCSAQTLSGTLNKLLIEELDVNTDGNVDIEVGSGDDVNNRALKSIYFNDKGFQGESVTLKFFVIPSPLNFHKEQNIKFVLKSITSEHYDYLRTSEFQHELEDGGALSEPVQISTNVKNGLGIFTGYNYSIYTVVH
jgi:hypothetical protein